MKCGKQISEWGSGKYGSLRFLAVTIWQVMGLIRQKEACKTDASHDLRNRVLAYQLPIQFRPNLRGILVNIFLRNLPNSICIHIGGLERKNNGSIFVLE